MGSGTTGIGCINTNRKFIGIELNEKYYKLSKYRIHKTISNLPYLFLIIFVGSYTNK